MLPSQPPWPSRRLLQSSDYSAVSNPNRILSVPPADPPSGSSGQAVLFIGALLCLVICVTSLAAVARCVLWRLNRAYANVDGAPSSPTSSPAADAGLFGGGGGHQHGGGAAGTSVTTTTTTTTIKGLNKRALKALPKLAYADAVAAAAAARGADADGEDWWNKAEEVLTECAICLAEFGEWEEVRVMPQCGHGFHVACVDTWLRSNSSCPSCRRIIVIDDPDPRRCRKCEDTVLETVIEASSSSAAASSRRGRGRRSRGRGRGFLPEQQE